MSWVWTLIWMSVGFVFQDTAPWWRRFPQLGGFRGRRCFTLLFVFISVVNQCICVVTLLTGGRQQHYPACKISRFRGFHQPKRNEQTSHVRPSSAGVLERGEWCKQKELLQQKGVLGDLEPQADKGYKTNFTHLSSELHPRVKTGGNRLKRAEVDGKCWLER